MELALHEREERRVMIHRLQEDIKAAGQPGCVEGTLRHFFSPGWYMREYTAPAGQVVVGKLHKHAHQNCLSVGRVRVFTEHGDFEMSAPYNFVSEPGTKRVVLLLEDTVWTTYHANPTNTRNLAELEAQVIATTYEELPNDLVCSGSSSSDGRDASDRRDTERGIAGCEQHQLGLVAMAGAPVGVGEQCSGQQDACRNESSEQHQDGIQDWHPECAASPSEG